MPLILTCRSSVHNIDIFCLEKSFGKNGFLDPVVILRSFDLSQRLTATLFGKPISHHSPLETLDILYEGEGFIEIQATECPYLISEPLYKIRQKLILIELCQ